MATKQNPKKSMAEQIRNALTRSPNKSHAKIASELDTSPAYVATIASIARRTAREEEFKAKQMDLALDQVHDVATGKLEIPQGPIPAEIYVEPDLVNHPSHYKIGGVETIDFIEAKGLGYHLGNVVKYISRAGRKGTSDGMEDLRKARWYLDRAIEKNEIAPPTK